MENKRITPFVYGDITVETVDGAIGLMCYYAGNQNNDLYSNLEEHNKNSLRWLVEILTESKTRESKCPTKN